MGIHSLMLIIHTAVTHLCASPPSRDGICAGGPRPQTAIAGYSNRCTSAAAWSRASTRPDAAHLERAVIAISFIIYEGAERTAGAGAGEDGELDLRAVRSEGAGGVQLVPQREQRVQQPAHPRRALREF